MELRKEYNGFFHFNEAMPRIKKRFLNEMEKHVVKLKVIEKKTPNIVFEMRKKEEIDMEVQIFLKGKKEPLIYKGDRIDILDFEMDHIKYKQIRYFYFKKGMSKSEFVQEDLINKIVTN